MSTEEAARRLARQAYEMLLMAETEQAACGWRKLIIDHLTFDSPEGAALCQQVMDLFDRCGWADQPRTDR
ncbi:hypothetical protein [Streptomyces sp. NPDC006863]|uniref:hypothetical protein n=1 Tax=unclassified Streptomyces TaxID=2593676 RepID=UPI0033E06498